MLVSCLILVCCCLADCIVRKIDTRNKLWNDRRSSFCKMNQPNEQPHPNPIFEDKELRLSLFFDVGYNCHCFESPFYLFNKKIGNHVADQLGLRLYLFSGKGPAVILSYLEKKPWSRLKPSYCTCQQKERDGSSFPLLNLTQTRC